MSNQLKILMWKHLVHMRQNWVKLLIIYLIPMFSSGLIYWAASTTESQIVPECDYAAVPLLTLPAQFLEAKYLNTLLKTGADIFCTNLPSKAESFSLAHLDLSSYFRKKRAVSEYTSPDSSKNKSQLQDILCGERNKRIRYGDIPPMGFLLSGFIGYFPRTNQSASVMLTIAEQLRSYHLQILKFQSQSGLANETIQILQVLAQCWLDPTVRILGFNTESDAIDFAKNLDFRFNLTWGILNLQNLTNAKFDYQLISHSGSEFSISSLLLQDLLENSFIKQISSKQPVLLPQHKLKPRPCRSDERNFAQIQMIIGLVMGFSFAITSASFVGEIVYEKCAGLHEYLLVLGVSNSSLKLSWYLYGLILFGPVGLTLALIIFNLPGGILVFIDWKLIVVVFGLHTFAQLCFAYFLSTLIQTPTNSSTVAGVVYFILHLAIVFTNVSQFPKTGGSLAKARVGCIYCGTGATICLSYMIEWSKRQSSTSFSNAFTSPVDNDKFGGVGEGLLWILADIVIYLSLGWYLDKTMPKRYGLHEPFHFFLKKSYWRKAKQIGDKSATEKKQEKHNNKTLVLATDNLCKTYGQRKSLNHFRLSLYQSELVTLLGNNGAGKTTLINLLTGLMSPTSGTIVIDQLDIRYNIAKIRQSLGFCPQGNESVLYQGMTVNFHYLFYGYLRGFARQTLEYLIEASLADFDMSESRYQSVSRLSGGMMRKLSVAFAFLNNPKLVILDEPTSSIDAVSKKKIWDVLLKRKVTSTTILLSTHDMSEAELLSDRVALMSKGHLIKVAPPGTLIEQNGGGVTIVISHTTKQPNRIFLMEFITSFIPLASMLEESGSFTTVLIQLRAARAPIMATFLAELDKSFKQLGIISYRIVEPSLSNVFFNVCCPKREELKSPLESNQNYTGWRLFLSQLYGMLFKRFILSWRSVISVIFQFPLPVITVLLMVVAFDTNQQIIDGVEHSVKIGKDHSFFISGSTVPLAYQFIMGLSDNKLSNGFCLDSFRSDLTCLNNSTLPRSNLKITGCPARNLTYPSFFVTREYHFLFTADDSNLTDWLLAAEKDADILGGFEMEEILVTGCYSNQYETFGYSYCSRNYPYTTLTAVTLWSSDGGKRSAFITFYNNLLLNATLKSSGMNSRDVEIVKSTKETQLISNEPLNASVTVTVSLALFLTLAVTVITFPSLIVLVNERASGCKHLQLLSGLSKWTFWMGNLLWDLISLLISLGLILSIILWFHDDFNNPEISDLFLILITYGLSLTLFNYLLSFMFRAARHAIIVVLALQIVSNISCLVLQLFKDREWFDSANLFLNVIPPYFCSNSIYNLGTYQLADVYSKDNYLVWEKLGKRLTIAWGTVATLSTLTFLLETDCHVAIVNVFHFKPKSQDSENVGTFEDPSLLKEIRRLEIDRDKNTLVVKNLSKLYWSGKYGLKDLTFGVQSGIFCLLGPNGAGKSTLMRILTKLTVPTTGDVLITDKNLQSRRIFSQTSIGYCPQGDQFFNNLTPKEHLRLFARIRGIPQTADRKMVDDLMRILELTNQQCHKLSGGNRRKLNFALAIFSRPKLIYLDEAEKGMDISARDAVCRLIKCAADNGSTIVTITHYLNEAENHCANLAVLHDGQLKLIGTPKYVADQQSLYHLVKFYLKLCGCEQVAHSIATHFQRSHPRCEISRLSKTFMTVRLPTEDLKLWKLHRSLQELMDNSKDVLVYTVSQDTFEMSLEKFFNIGRK